jgi:hypothetical protein
MTNYHVVRKVHRQLVAANQVVCRFDYKVLADGVSVIKPYGLASDWLVDHSSYSELDFDVAPRARNHPRSFAAGSMCRIARRCPPERRS